jgi:hypothetical protein
MNTIQLNQPEPGQDWTEFVWNQVKSLDYGAVEITIRDARIVQIDKTERLRFEKSGALQVRESSRNSVNSIPLPIRFGNAPAK